MGSDDNEENKNREDCIDIGIDIEVDNYLNLRETNEYGINTLIYWDNLCKDYPHLSAVAQYIFVVPATYSEVERIFYKMNPKNIITKK